MAAGAAGAARVLIAQWMVRCSCSAATASTSRAASIGFARWIWKPAVRAASFTYGVRKALSARTAKNAKKAQKTAKKLSR